MIAIPQEIHMGDTIIVNEDEAKPEKPADVIVVNPATVTKPEKVITEKTTITETKVE
jgi:hypothetical protein